MLKGIDPLLNPELLQVLAAMGHGDEIVLVDANFPAESVARETVHGLAIRVDCALPRAVEAVLTLLPIDNFEPGAVRCMEVVGDPQAVPEVVAEAAVFFAAEGADITGVPRFDFYDEAKRAYAIVQTAERRLYGNFIIRKGVISPPDKTA
ncbi:RbsD/FucU family protein [Aurantimonas sp. A3-2-R12]|uniref:RbsD/FucU family protein n=1 Tax=Aurantimonas sp. A3-2-R12 TaxID=3114362 RepID=UPI002E18182C|nr:RbsD/FucU domain-containing protein [Aurantimonas sp. A3-2-R12]